MTVEQTLNSMSAYEYEEWKAYYLIHPFGPEADSLHHAITASCVINANRDSKSSPVSPKDLTISYVDKTEYQSPEDMHALLQRFL